MSYSLLTVVETTASAVSEAVGGGRWGLGRVKLKDGEDSGADTAD
jgi:hypothetical protein